MPVFYHGGRAYHVGFRGLGAPPPAPDQIQQLPFDLLRSHEYPRDPAEMRQAVAQAGDTPPSDYLPARMMETRWKTPPYQRAWGSNVVALMEAMRSYAGLQSQMIAPQGHVPAMDINAAPAQLQAARLPQASDNFDQDMYVDPLARNALPDNRIAVRGPDLAQLSAMDVQMRTANGKVAPAKLQHALDQVAASSAAVNRILGG
jgi:hypothetical protein